MDISDASSFNQQNQIDSTTDFSSDKIIDRGKKAAKMRNMFGKLELMWSRGDENIYAPG